MADEDGNSTHKKDLVDFPPVNLLDTLISSFPKEWRGIFAALDSENFPVQAATFWLQKKSSNNMLLSDIPPNWNDFIDHLVSDFPVVLNDKLFFKPRILLLPLSIQRNALGFISYHSCVVPVESLEKLVHSLSKFSIELEGWRATYVKILASKINELKRSRCEALNDKGQSNDGENNLLYTEIITEESKARFEELINKNKSSRNIPWFSQVLDSEMREDDGNISEKHLLSTHGDDIDMVDLTTITCTRDVDLQTDTKLQEIHPGSSHDFDDSDIEIIEVIESPGKQIRIEHIADVNIRELTVPPPPEHLIIDMEDVPEHLIVETEVVPEHLITEEAAAADSKLGDVLQPKFSALQTLLTGLEIKEDNFSNELDIFFSCSSLEMEYICTQLNLKSIKESLAISLCTQFVALATEPSFGNAAIFATHCLLPKVQELKQAASRALFTAVSLFAKKHSRAFCDGVIARLIQQSNFDTPQVDLVNKVVKECVSEDTRILLLELIFATKSENQGCPFLWSENTVSVVQTVVDLKPEFSDDLFRTFAGVLEQQSRHLSKSLKFAKMLLAVIKTYGKHVSMHFNTFVRILEGNETFLKKAGLSALQKTSNS